MSKVYYIAGPMTGYPKHNYPLFIEIGKKLRKLGYSTIGPVELDDSETLQTVMNGEMAQDYGYQYSNFLVRDIEILTTPGRVDGIVFLPGWHKSRGARLEACVGVLWDLDLMFWDPDTETPQPVHKSDVAEKVV